MASGGYGGYSGSQQGGFAGQRRQIVPSQTGMPPVGQGGPAGGQGLPNLGGSAGSHMAGLGSPGPAGAAQGTAFSSGYAGLSRRQAPPRGQLTAEDFPALGGSPVPAPQAASQQPRQTQADPGRPHPYPSLGQDGSGAAQSSQQPAGTAAAPGVPPAAAGSRPAAAEASSGSGAVAEDPGVIDSVAPGGPMAGVSKSARGGGTGRSSFGLLGLLDVIRMQDEDLVTLALGTELSSLGVNLQASRLANHMGLPWADNPSTERLPFVLPSCYLDLTSSLPQAAFSSMPAEVLLYSFYSMTGDVLQSCAAEQLYQTGWFYNGEQQLWYTRKDGSAKDSASASSSSATPASRGPPRPTDKWIFFNVKVWQKAEHPGEGMDRVIAGFVPAEEIFETARQARAHADRADAEAATIAAAAGASLEDAGADAASAGGSSSRGGRSSSSRRRASSSQGRSAADLASSLAGPPSKKTGGSVWKGKASRGGR